MKFCPHKWGKLVAPVMLALFGIGPLEAQDQPNSPPPKLVQTAKLGQPEGIANAQPDTGTLAPVLAVPVTPFSVLTPIRVIPNFLGGFVARGTQACYSSTGNTSASQTLNFTGSGRVAGTNIAPGLISGPGGPYLISSPISFSGRSPFVLGENGELTPLIRTTYPGATFVNGGGTTKLVEDEVKIADYFYNYLFNTSSNTGAMCCVNLPNPAGGGLVGRNKYFENGNALPQDRVYFFYNHIGSYHGMGGSFDINRYVIGGEKTFFDGNCSIEVRVPFAGTANSDQICGDSFAINHAEFGNVGVALKSLIYQTPTFAVSAGLGFSLPTANDSRLIIGNTPAVVIQNNTCILQPMFGIAYAPNDYFYSQFGAQFDFDPSGNPVQALNRSGGLSRIGVLHDQHYAFLSYACGYWVYQNAQSSRAVALQGELHYDGSMNSRDQVSVGSTTVSDLSSGLNFFSATTGVICRLDDAVNLSVGVSFPLAGDRLYDWNVIAQVNVNFGRRR